MNNRITLLLNYRSTAWVGPSSTLCTEVIQCDTPSLPRSTRRSTGRCAKGHQWPITKSTTCLGTFCIAAFVATGSHCLDMHLMSILEVRPKMLRMSQMFFGHRTEVIVCSPHVIHCGTSWSTQHKIPHRTSYLTGADCPLQHRPDDPSAKIAVHGIEIQISWLILWSC
jgi:hypothetical protein